MAMKLKIKKGDTVVVIAGRDKGKSGEVIEVRPNDERLLVRGINMVTKHVRASQAGPGGIEKRESPIHISNVAHIDPESKKPTRVGFENDKNGKKTRIARRSGVAIA